MPRCGRRQAGWPTSSTPSWRIEPDWHEQKPLMALSTVVLPAPFGPMRDVIRPGARSSDKLRTAVTPPKEIVTSHTRSAAASPYRLPIALITIRYQEVASRQPYNGRKSDGKGWDAASAWGHRSRILVA